MSELKRSKETALMGGAALSVPKGWIADTVERYDDEGRPLTLSLVKSDARGRIGFLRFEALDRRPVWRGNGAVRETRTKSHENVIYRVYVRQSPSGDDTPGKYCLDAYVRSNEAFWTMEATFFTPVEPELKDAVNYIDCIAVTRIRSKE